MSDEITSFRANDCLRYSDFYNYPSNSCDFYWGHQCLCQWHVKIWTYTFGNFAGFVRANSYTYLFKALVPSLGRILLPQMQQPISATLGSSIFQFQQQQCNNKRRRRRAVWPDWAIFALWATIQSRWQQLFYPNCPHCKAIFVKVSKSFISLVTSFLGNFYRNLAIFIWSHCSWSSRSWTELFITTSENTHVRLG